jgi:hypothetical protein
MALGRSDTYIKKEVVLEKVSLLKKNIPKAKLKIT